MADGEGVGRTKGEPPPWSGFQAEGREGVNVYENVVDTSKRLQENLRHVS